MARRGAKYQPGRTRGGAVSGRRGGAEPRQSNGWLRFTGKPCDAVVRVDESGAARVKSSFVPSRVVDLTPVADTSYLGELGGGSALVVQFDGDGALLDLTYTSYDEAGDLNYGVSGAGTFFKECVQITRLE